MKKILLLGGAGFIGLGLARSLASREGVTVTIADNFFRAGGQPDTAVLALQESTGLKLVAGDFSDPSTFSQLDKDYDQVYMLASVVGVDYVNSMPHEIIRINTSLILNTLEWIRSAGIGRVLFTSTSECYAGSVEAFGYPVPTDEKVPLAIQNIGHPRFTYAVTKMLGESAFLNYARVLGFESVIVRYHNVYGPRMGFKHVIPHLAQRFAAGESPFKIYGAEQTRSFNYIDDAVKGTILAMEEGISGEVYHIGAMEEISIEQLVRYVGSLFQYQGSYENAPTYPGSVARRCPDITKAREQLGYEPTVSWREGVDRTIAWYRSFLAANPQLHESFYDARA